MPVQIECPKCHQRADVSRSAGGHIVACAACQHNFEVPLGSGEIFVEWGVGAVGSRALLHPGRETTIGRAMENDLMLPGELVSRQHAVVRWESNEWRIHDLNTPNGTHLDGVSVKVATLSDGRRFNIGGFSLHVSIADGVKRHSQAEIEQASNPAIVLPEAPVPGAPAVSMREANPKEATQVAAPAIREGLDTGAERPPGKPRGRRGMTGAQLLLIMVAVIITPVLAMLIWLKSR